MKEKKEIPSEPDWNPLSDPSMSRSSFLKTAGFFFGAGSFSACSRIPGFKAVPQLFGDENAIPGKAEWYATTCGGCAAGCGALAKVRDGRPIKLEGNPDHPIGKGGLCAVGQASLLGLYDSRRLSGALWKNSPASWSEVDLKISAGLKAARSSGKKIRILTGSISSPSLLRAISRLISSYPGARHIAYDSLSISAIAQSHQLTHGARVLPRYLFENADEIVSIDADFLGTWISPVEHSAGWRQKRVPSGTSPRMSHHAQFESRMSLTGTNADRRVVLAPGTEGLLAAHLAQEIARRSNAVLPYAKLPAPPIAAAEISAAAARLLAARGRALVVCGTNDLSAQTAVNHANQLLGAYGNTLDIRRPSKQKRGDDGALETLFTELRAGEIGALIIHAANPAAELPAPGSSWTDALAQAGLVVSTASHLDETALLAQAVCPDHHFLESWLDHEPATGIVSLTQAVIQPFGDTRSALESLLAWDGEKVSALDALRSSWRGEKSWSQAVHDGWASVSSGETSLRGFDSSAAGRVPAKTAPSAELSLLLYPKISMLDGRHAQNPWLQELPDPVTKVAWDNYAALSPKTAERLGIEQGDVVKISGNGKFLELPALIQRGQSDAAVCVALGYGRTGTERFYDAGPDWISAKSTVTKGGRVGVNAAPLLSLKSGLLEFFSAGISLQKTGRKNQLACTQEYHSLQMPERLARFPGDSRDIVRETSLVEYAKSPAAGNPAPHPAHSLWPPSLDPENRRWAMAIDLNLCSGCSACVIACQAENNVPVVGKDEIARRRDMAWLRLDRYYADTPDGVKTSHQPMLCQHCGNAPCETVCPVAATAGSDDGLNQQVYNRCVGTRYCANNCPYKVRRFNWFEYRQADIRENLVLNPDVTVRSRGVMEKCSFCVQRIQEAKIAAKSRGEVLRDGDFKTACQESCPSRAIVFGDANESNSAVARLLKDPRRYRVLEELQVEPAIGYLTKVRNE